MHADTFNYHRGGYHRRARVHDIGRGPVGGCVNGPGMSGPVVKITLLGMHGLQMLCMMAQMILDEGGDEKIAVIVTRLHS